MIEIKIPCPSGCLNKLTYCKGGYDCIFNQVNLPPSDPYPAKQDTNTLQALRLANPERCKAFGHTVDQMPTLFWSTAVAGEVGEMCNIIKKKERGDIMPDSQYKEMVGNEAADVVIYLDLLCTKLGINLEDFIISKFNEVSDRVKSPIKL